MNIPAIIGPTSCGRMGPGCDSDPDLSHNALHQHGRPNRRCSQLPKPWTRGRPRHSSRSSSRSRRPTATSSGLRTAMRAMVSIVTVRSLSLSAYVGTPPNCLRHWSIHEMRLGIVLLFTASTTRKRLQASHAQNNHVLAPLTDGPSHQSNWNHMPGSGIQGR